MAQIFILKKEGSFIDDFKPLYVKIYSQLKNFVVFPFFFFSSLLSFSQTQINYDAVVNGIWRFNNDINSYGGKNFFTDGRKAFYVKNSLNSSYLEVGIAEGYGDYHGLTRAGDIVLRAAPKGGRFIICNPYTENHPSNTSKVTGILGSAGKSGIWIHNNGNIRLGTFSSVLPNVRLLVDGNITIGSYNDPTHGKLMIKGDGAEQGLTIWNESGATTLRLWTDATSNMGFLTRGGQSTNGIAISLNGNVGIGVTSPTAKLHVAGSLKATEVRVEAQTADFVFDDDYSLRSLDEVEQFIKGNNHLPEIPSAAEMETSGVNLAEMNKLLLQKIEELTLYLIQQQKEIDQLKTISHETTD